MNHPRKRKQIQLFVKNPKAQLLIFGPTPGQNTPWMGLDNRTKLGRIGIGKKRRDLMLELGRKSGSGGRMIGMGHGFKGRKETEQWWRMDYHSGHGVGSSDWADDDYQFHTLTAGGNK